MLFNSYIFIFLFLPLVAAGFAALQRIGTHRDPLSWLVASSVFFYGFHSPTNILIIAPLLLFNFAAARKLQRAVTADAKVCDLMLYAGIAVNVLALAYFKYKNVLLDATNSAFGTHFAAAPLPLPLGISFITFQMIAFLCDVRAGRVKEVTPLDFSLFAFFFPRLIAGPIVRYGEVMPQFAERRGQFSAADAAVGISLFSIGLFKKVILADGVAEYASPAFSAAASGEAVTLLAAWAGALGYTLQLYFDFSGYSDMALGSARLLGIRLPLNFNSPLKARSIVEFWSRWHVTLTRFLTDYIYTPVTLHLARRRLAAGRAVLAGRRSSPAAIGVLIAVPTMLTMAVSGLWHGTGLQFLAWGLLHGALLTVNQAWRLLRPRFWRDQASYERVMGPIGFGLTFTAVVFAMVLFRASSIGSAAVLFKGMVGGNGVALPHIVLARLGPLGGWLLDHGVRYDWTAGSEFVFGYLWIAALLAIVWLLPNSLELLERDEPAPGIRQRTGVGRPAELWGLAPAFARMSWVSAVFIATLSVAGVFGLGRVSEFVYWQF